MTERSVRTGEHQKIEGSHPAPSPYPLAKVIEIVARSEKGFDHAVITAIDEASRTLRGIHGIQVTGWNVKVAEDNKPIEYRVTCKVAFEVER